MLNDFIFCPYSIYLHNVYVNADEGLYHAKPQTQGRLFHKSIDEKVASHNKGELFSLPVLSEKYGLMGKIDVYKTKDKLLIERKYQLKHIFQGQVYQLWAQYLCLLEMGYGVEHIAFYEISSNRLIPVSLPTERDIAELSSFIKRFRKFNPVNHINTNPNKCKHCIYCNLCDKTEEENVY